MATKAKGPGKSKRSAKRAGGRTAVKAPATASAKSRRVALKRRAVDSGGLAGSVGASTSPEQSKAATPSAAIVLRTRKSLGVTQNVFARLIGVSERSVSGWELGKPVNPGPMRRVKEMSRLAEQLQGSMRKSFIPDWLVTPNEALGGISPVEALERGENDRLWRSVFFLGSGLPS
jgi:DNA-binding transcriptional regulator YiaG